MSSVLPTFPSPSVLAKLQDATQMFVKAAEADDQQLQVIKQILKNLLANNEFPQATFKCFDQLVTQALSFSKPLDPSKLAQLTKIQQIMIDTLKTIKHMAVRIPYDMIGRVEYDQLGRDIAANNLLNVIPLVTRSDIKPQFALFGAQESFVMPVVDHQHQYYMTGLGIAAFHGAMKVMEWLLAKGEDPNYAIQYTMAQALKNCPCGLACNQKSFVPAWYAAVASNKIDYEAKLTIVKMLLDKGANPLQRDSDGNFWLTRCVRSNACSPALMHLMLSSVTDMTKAIRTDLKGKQVTLLDDLVSAFTKMSTNLRPKVKLTPSTNAFQQIMGGSSKVLRVVAGDAPTEALTKVEVEGTKKWQSDFLNHTAVMIAHGIPYSDSFTLLEAIRKQFVLHIPPSVIIKADEGAIMAADALPLISLLQEELINIIPEVAPRNLILEYTNTNVRLAIAEFVYNQLFINKTKKATLVK